MSLKNSFEEKQRDLMNKEMFRALDDLDFAKVEFCLKKGASLEARDEKNRTASGIVFERLAQGLYEESISRSDVAFGILVKLTERQRKEILFDIDGKGKSIFDLLQKAADMAYSPETVKRYRDAFLSMLEDLPPAGQKLSTGIDMEAKKDMIVQPLKLRTPAAASSDQPVANDVPTPPKRQSAGPGAL